MAAITPEEALAYFRRWELVREAEARELRRTPMETKLQQLASLMASRHVFGPEPDREAQLQLVRERRARDRKSTRLNSSHSQISYAVFCLKKKKKRYTVSTRDNRLHAHERRHSNLMPR